MENKRLTILVVDSDAQVLPMACRILSERGKHNVLKAMAPETGIQIIGVIPDIDVVITDTSGFELLEEAKSKIPKVRNFLMTGRHPLDLPELKPYGVEGIIEKPDVISGFKKFKLIPE